MVEEVEGAMEDLFPPLGAQGKCQYSVIIVSILKAHSLTESWLEGLKALGCGVDGYILYP